MSNVSDKVNDLNASNIRKNRRLVKTFRKSLSMRMNPFDETLDKDYLYNISTGRAAPPEVADYLLTVQTSGEESKKQFIQQNSNY